MQFSVNSPAIWDSLLCLLDSVLAIGIISPIVIGYWRGCWQLMDYYLFPNNDFHSLWASTSIGIGLGIFFGLFQNILNSIFCQKKCRITFYVVSRIYTIIYCVGCVNHWRGVWMALDHYHNISWESGAMSAGIGLFALAITRGLRNILAPPFLTVADRREGFFTVPTLFNTKKSRCGCGCQCFFLDVVFTIVVTGSLVVFVWRGAWVFLDRKLFPDNETYSAWGSLVIGLTVTILTFLAQMIMIPCLRDIKNGFCRLVLEDMYFTACFIGAVNMWRGVWNILNIYLYPDRPVLSNMITAVGGNIILICLFCGNSIPGRGAQMDGFKEGSMGSTLETKYIRSFCKFKRKTRKQNLDVGKLNDVRKVSSIPSVYLEEPISEKRIILDGRGAGDGNSYSDGFGENDHVQANQPSFDIPVSYEPEMEGSNVLLKKMNITINPSENSSDRDSLDFSKSDEALNTHSAKDLSIP